MRMKVQAIAPSDLRLALRLRESDRAQFDDLPSDVKLAALELEGKDREQAALTAECYEPLLDERDRDPAAFSRKYSRATIASLDAYVKSKSLRKPQDMELPPAA